MFSLRILSIFQLPDFALNLTKNTLTLRILAIAEQTVLAGF
jgi:hypothetical protein